MIAPKLSSIQEYVINIVANDYENMALIVDEAIQWGAKEKNRVAESDVLEAVSGLINNGLIACYRFSESADQFERCEFEAGSAKDLWYYVSTKGKDYLAHQES